MSEGLDKVFWLAIFKAALKFFQHLKNSYGKEEKNEKDCKDVVADVVCNISIICVNFLPILRNRFWPEKVLQRRTD